jgi:hypothetical protein
MEADELDVIVNMVIITVDLNLNILTNQKKPHLQPLQALTTSGSYAVETNTWTQLLKVYWVLWWKI